jgi:hypothetical protein
MRQIMMIRCQVLTTGMKRLNSIATSQTRAAHSSTGPQSENQGGLWKIFTSNAPAVGVLVAISGTAVYVQRAIDSSEKKLAIAEEKITMANLQAELKLKAEVAQAELRVAEKFLMYGYAEEYSSYQSKALPKKVKVFLLI